jgi:hypothetical protein
MSSTRCGLTRKSREYVMLAWCISLPCCAVLLFLNGSGVDLFSSGKGGAIPLGPAEEARVFEWTMREYATSAGVEGVKRMKGAWLRATVVRELEKMVGTKLDVHSLSDAELKELCTLEITAPFKHLLISHHALRPDEAELVPFKELKVRVLRLLKKKGIEGRNYPGRKLNRLTIDQLHALAKKHTKHSVLRRHKIVDELPPVRYAN